MSTRVTLAGHPIHPMLVTLPIGLWIFSMICDFALIASGWLGGHLVHVLGVTQPKDAAHADAARDRLHPRT